MGRLIVQENGCCLWPGGKAGGNGPHGSYGVVSYEGKQQYVHRLLYEKLVGPIPEDMVLDHVWCDTPLCGNPFHLLPVPRGVNSLRGTGLPAVNAQRTTCAKGHPYQGDNLIVLQNGWRKCRECSRQRDESRQAQRNAEARLKRLRDPEKMRKAGREAQQRRRDRLKAAARQKAERP